MPEIRANTVSNAAGTGPVTLTGQSAAKAWVNYSGQGTPSISDSFNVSSLTDNTTGQQTSNFTNSMSDANFGFQANACNTIDGDNNGYHCAQQSRATSPVATGIRVCSFASNNGAAFDARYVTVTTQGDLA